MFDEENDEVDFSIRYLNESDKVNEDENQDILLNSIKIINEKKTNVIESTEITLNEIESFILSDDEMDILSFDPLSLEDRSSYENVYITLRNSNNSYMFEKLAFLANPYADYVVLKPMTKIKDK